MISWKYKLWHTAGTAAALGLAACGGEAGENGASQGEAGESGGVASATVAAAGGEHGEAGVANAYAGVEGAQRTALRLQHLKGFVLVAERVAADAPADAAVLVGQGLLEVYDPAPDQFGGLDTAALRAAGAGGTPQNLRTAAHALDAARPADADHAALAVSMIDIATGLYQHVDQDGAVDPIEYQHSLGAALSARDALSGGRQKLRARNARAYDEALTEIERFVALWPGATAPEHPAPYRDLLAQSSRVRLALSPLLF
ncbi:MAG: hypothetical protein ABL883_01595 [Terricaulis sp.]